MIAMHYNYSTAVRYVRNFHPRYKKCFATTRLSHSFRIIHAIQHSPGLIEMKLLKLLILG